MVAAVAPAPLRRRTLPALTAAVVSGAVVALQQRVNGELAVELGDAVLAALVSFATGTLALLVAVAASPAARRALPALRLVPWWMWSAGLAGAVLVAVAAAAAPVVGVALLTVGLVAGQTAGGVAVDRAGLGPGGPRPPDAWRLVGAGLCLAAVALSSAGDGAADADPLLLALVLGAGLLIAVQHALNGRVRAVVGAPVATLVNFAVGTAGLVVGLAARAALGGVDVERWPGEWWLYTGGPMGAAFIAVAALVVRQLGVLRLGLALVCGQLTGALLLDVVVPSPGVEVAAATVLGALLTFVAVAVSGRGRT